MNRTLSVILSLAIFSQIVDGQALVEIDLAWRSVLSSRSHIEVRAEGELVFPKADSLNVRLVGHYPIDESYAVTLNDAGNTVFGGSSRIVGARGPGGT